MEDLKTKRTVWKQQFTRAANSLTRLLDKENGLETTMRRRFDELSTKWQGVQDAHDIYMTQVSDGEVEEESKWIEELVERFEDIEIDYDTALQKFSGMEQTTKLETQVQSSGEEVVSASLLNSTNAMDAANVIDSNNPLRRIDTNFQGQHLQLERLKLEKFNGELRKYPSFKERFKLYIEPICLRSQLPFILRSHLEPTVREEVENVEDDMNCLWERLDLKYANHIKFVDIVLSDIEKTVKGDAKAALHLINTVEKAYNDLQKIGAAQEMANATIIAMIKKRFPDEMRLDWVKKVASEGEQDSAAIFKMLLQFLAQWRQMLECDDQVIKKLEKKSGMTHLATPRSGDGSGSVLKMSETCWLHEENGNHPIWKCNTFRALPLNEKLALIDKKKACHACLETQCKGATNAEECGRGFKCNVDRCNKPHNSLIHS